MTPEDLDAADALDAPTLLLLAAGLGSRYGGGKQTDPVGPEGAWLLDYTVVDAASAGFGRVVLVVRPDMRTEVADHVAGLLDGRLPFELVVQRTPPDRRRPLGTAHAVLSAGDALPGRFAVANADDHYGADALDGLGRWLARLPDRSASRRPRWALVGYPVQATLSPHGPVNRGLIQTDEEGRVRRIREATGLQREDGEVVGLLGGERLGLEPAAPVSMNLWGFDRALLPVLEAAFDSFMAAGPGPDEELLLPDVVGDAVAAGRASVELLPFGTSWVGMTHPEDRPRVATVLARRGAPEIPGAPDRIPRTREG